MKSIFEQLDDDPLSNKVEVMTGGKERTFDFLDVCLVDGAYYAVLAEPGSDEAEVFLIEDPFGKSENFIPVIGKTAETVFEIYEMKNFE